MAEEVKYIREQILGDDGKEILLVFAGRPTAEAYRALESYAGWRAARLEKRVAPSNLAPTTGVMVDRHQTFRTKPPVAP